jgi:hypothetical protein
MTVSNELIDSLLADYKKPEDLIGENGLLAHPDLIGQRGRYGGCQSLAKPSAGCAVSCLKVPW